MVRSVVSGIARFAGAPGLAGALAMGSEFLAVSCTSATAGTIGGQSMITVTLALRTG